MSINVREIAKIAGVSPTTVSLVLNGHRGVSEEKRKTVQRILEEKGYKKKVFKSKERTRRVIHIVRYGVNGEQNANNYELDSHIINCFHKVCHELGYQVSIIICNAGNLKDTISNLTPSRNSGVALIGSMLTSEQVAWLDKSSLGTMPSVCIDNYMMHTHLFSVCPDNYNISCMIIDYLNGLGVKTVGYICDELRTTKLCDRERGFYKSAERLDMIAESKIALKTTPKDAYEQLKRHFLAAQSLSSVYFAETAPLAVIAINVLHELGKRVPEDVGIVCGDSIQDNMMISPSITYVSISYEDICRIAVNLVDMQINAESISNSSEHVCVSGHLIKGDITK